MRGPVELRSHTILLVTHLYIPGRLVYVMDGKRREGEKK
jgi:hypothetical protein